MEHCGAVPHRQGGAPSSPSFVPKPQPSAPPSLFDVLAPAQVTVLVQELQESRRRTNYPVPHTGVVTAYQLEMISLTGVMHGQAVIAGIRMPVSVILDCLAAGMTAEEITAEYPHGHGGGRTRGRRLRRRAGARRTAPAAAVTVKFKLDENLPVLFAAILTSAGHEVDTVTDEDLIWTPDRDVPILTTCTISLGIGAIRAFAWLGAARLRSAN
jgi:hypothetical protein